MDDHAAHARVVLPGEIFFSLADSRGVVTGVNDVFTRIARFDREELIGAPHSIIRHPDMPGGVFRLMWDTLQAGRPFAGYVLNKAKDGVDYWVYATVTPLVGGYLSVRSAPCLTDVWVTVAALYKKVLGQESELRAAGANRRAAAEAGRDLLLEGLAEIGFASYEDFMVATLPGEVIERSIRADSAASRPTLDDPDLEAIRGNAAAIGDEAAALLAHIEHFRGQSANLRHAFDGALEATRNQASAATAARSMSELVGTDAPAVLSTAQAMEDGLRQTLVSLTDLGSQITWDARLLRGLQIRIAIVKLHADMVASFAEGGAAASDRAKAVINMPELGHALELTVSQLSDTLSARTQRMQSLVAALTSTSEELSQVQSFLFMWRALLIRHGVSSGLSQQLPPIDRQLSAGSTQIPDVQALAERCLEEARPYDDGPITSRVREVASLAAQMQESGLGSNDTFER